MARAPRLSTPPGRAGRLWLDQRLAVARRGVDLLDRKLRILSGEVERLRAAADESEREWRETCAQAQRWLVRARLLGGERSVRLASGGEFAEVRIWHSVTMGARHPAGAECAVPDPATWDGATVAFARRAHADALAAAVRHAAASAALRIVEEEATATRYRLRAVRDRWIPRLEQALAEVKFALEEAERADGARLRQALRRQGELAGSLAERPAPVGSSALPQ